MNKAVVVLVCAVAAIVIVTGCSTTQRAAQGPNYSAWDEAEAARRECRARQTEGELKTDFEVAQCINPRVLDAYEKEGNPDLDLVMLIGAKRLELAEQVDAGTITVGEASVVLAELAAKMTDVARQR